MKLKKKLGILFTIVAILPFVAGMAFITIKSNKAIKSDATGFLTEYTGKIAGALGSFLSDKRGFVEAYAQLPDARDFEWNRLKPILARVTRENGTFDAFLLARTDGTYYRSDRAGNPAPFYEQAPCSAG